MEVNSEGSDAVRNDWLRLFVRLPVAPAKDLFRDHQLVRGKLPVLFIRFGIYVNEFDDPIGIAPSSGSK